MYSFCLINYNANIVTTMFIDLYVFNVLYWRKTKKEKLWSHNKLENVQSVCSWKVGVVGVFCWSLFSHCRSGGVFCIKICFMVSYFCFCCVFVVFCSWDGVWKGEKRRWKQSNCVFSLHCCYCCCWKMIFLK